MNADWLPRAAVEVHELVKRYPKQDVNAVDGISFAVPAGEIFGLLGPNGAGKTTTVGILTTRVRATGGVARVAGVDVLRDPVRRGPGSPSYRSAATWTAPSRPGRTWSSTRRTTVSPEPTARPARPRCSTSSACSSGPTTRSTGTPAAWPSGS